MKNLKLITAVLSFIKAFDYNISIQIFRFELFGLIQESTHEPEF